MARPVKNNADYFPHLKDLRNDRRCKALRSKFGLSGYAVYMMFLETLTHAENFRITYNKMEMELLAGDFDMDSTLLNQIVDYCVLVNLLSTDQGFLFSLELETAMKPLVDYREKERGRNEERKTAAAKVVYPMVNNQNATQEDVYHVVNPVQVGVYPVVNTHSKGKKSKEEKSIESKEEGVAEPSPDSKTVEKCLEADEFQKEKSSAQKEKELLSNCKAFFLREAGVYVWEVKDDANLAALLMKIRATMDEDPPPKMVSDSFSYLIKRLPPYWRAKKFTISHLNRNFNEIINEIRNTNQEAGTTGKFGRHATADLASRARSFGRKGTGY